jgi:hypothetical protein
MILKLLNFCFEKLVGKVPEYKKQEFRNRFVLLLTEVTKAAAEGAVKGAKNG